MTDHLNPLNYFTAQMVLASFEHVRIHDSAGNTFRFILNDDIVCGSSCLSGKFKKDTRFGCSVSCFNITMSYIAPGKL